MQKFWKYQGTGNDFVLFDDRQKKLPVSKGSLWKEVCTRHMGVGADGIIFLQNSEVADLKMVYLNSDGGEVSMCGNGARCLLNFAKNELGIKLNENIKLETRDEVYDCKFVEGLPAVQFKQPRLIKEMTVSDFLPESEESFYIHNGVPHVVYFVSKIEDKHLLEIAPKVRFDKRFPEGTNVNFLEQVVDRFFVRTYERGVDGETLSCGTGVTACAYVVLEKLGGCSDYVNFETLGGQLKVQKDNDGYWLIGPSQFVFSGELDI